MALIHHIAVGHGRPPIVFVHGFACAHTDWDEQVAYLAPYHQTIAVDLRGHGASPGNRRVFDRTIWCRCGGGHARLGPYSRRASRPFNGMPRSHRSRTASTASRGGSGPHRWEPVRSGYANDLEADL